MLRAKGTGKGPTEQSNIRFDGDTAGFYRTKANEHGINISEFLHQTLVRDVIAGNVQDIEQRLYRLLDEVRAGGQGGGKVEIPDELWLSVLTAEYMLAAVVEARDVQQLYEAQNKARVELK